MTRRRRVVHVVEDLGSGGLETVVRNLVTGLDPGRFAPEVCCLSAGGAIADEIRAAGIPVEIRGMGRRPSARFLLTLARWLCGASVVHCHGYTGRTVGRVAALLAGRARVFAHVHTQEEGLAPRQRRIERALAAASRKVLCVSESVRHFVVAQEGIARARTEVVYNGVAAPRLPEPGHARARLGIPAEARVVACVGALQPHKGHAVLLEAVRLAGHRLPGLMALIVGDGPLRQELELRARRSGVAAMFTGHLPDVGIALGATDVLALLSPEREGLSLALIEGMSAARPLLGSRTGGIPEVVQDGVNGLLCTAGDPAAAAAAIAGILGDPVRAAAMGQAGRRIYQSRFTRERMIAEIERVYGF